uniref:Uncharacterized protein n=1 Tax=Molossus molossus TaxID=27622 RepID=A0A7J8FZ39_MOLMO|nr:hypothetical protein HJG59_008219 [Molossus molossus]
MFLFLLPLYENKCKALAGLAQRLECQPAVHRDPGSVPTEDAYLGCSVSPAQLVMWVASTRCVPFTSMFLSLSLSLSLFLSLPPILSEQKNGKKCPRVRIKKKEKEKKQKKCKIDIYICFLKSGNFLK